MYIPARLPTILLCAFAILEYQLQSFEAIFGLVDRFIPKSDVGLRSVLWDFAFHLHLVELAPIYGHFKRY